MKGFYHQIYQIFIEIRIKKYFAFLKMIHYIYPYRKKIIGLILFSIISIGISLCLPLITRLLIDSIIHNRNFELFKHAVILMFSFYLIGFVLTQIISYWSFYIRNWVELDLRLDYRKKCDHQDLEYFTQWQVGEHLYRNTTDINNVVGTLVTSAPQIILSLLSMFFALSFCLYLNLKITFLYLISIPLMIAVEILRSKKLWKVRKIFQETDSSMNDIICDYINRISIIKVFGREQTERIRYFKIAVNRFRLQKNIWLVEFWSKLGSWLVSAVWAGGVLVYGWYMVYVNELTLGSLMAINIYLMGLVAHINELREKISHFILSSISANRILETLDQPTDNGFVKFTNKALLLESNSGHIKTSNISFGYSKDDPLFDSLSIEIKPKSFIGISGANGCGKTTLIYLLASLLKPWKGDIYLHGYRLDPNNQYQLRSTISLALNDSHLFPGSIFANIAYGRKNLTKKEIEWAVNFVNLRKKIETLPETYHTKLGPDGIGLSSGEKQKLALARALVKDCTILFIDEGLSSIDNESINIILNNLKKLSKDKTIVLISHNKSVLNQCDNIFHLDNYNIKIKIHSEV